MFATLLLAAAASPLDYVPDQADFALVADAPRPLVEMLVHSKLRERFEGLAAVKEQLDSTGVRRARQLLAHFEKALGAKWPALLDDLAGGGLCLAGKQGAGTQPALFVLVGKDEKRQQKALDEVLALARAELERQESKDKLVTRDYHGVTAHALGDGLIFARVGPALIVSNKGDALKAALDLARAGGKSLAAHPDMAGMAALLPVGTKVRLWFNMRPFQATKEGKAIYADPRNDIIQTLFFGGYLSVLGRAPYFAAGVVPEADGVHVTFRAPAGLDGMGSDRLLHVPAAPALRPVLAPDNALYSVSFYFDAAKIWTERAKLFPPEQVKNFERGNTSGPGGFRFATLLETFGAAHRVVVAHQPKPCYAKRPQTRIPAFALVPEVRDPVKFGKVVDGLLVLAGLTLADQLKMESADEEYGGVSVTGFRFKEKETLPSDPADFRFNFSPCFARVGEQFVFCTTLELCRSMIDALKKEPAGARLPGKSRDRSFPEGLARLTADSEAELIAQTVLDQGVPPADAKAQVAKILELVR
ncbi:MAG: hypothetical protein ACRC33_05250, partial [Gemmataceae bacterium]